MTTKKTKLHAEKGTKEKRKTRTVIDPSRLLEKRPRRNVTRRKEGEVPRRLERVTSSSTWEARGKRAAWEARAGDRTLRELHEVAAGTEGSRVQVLLEGGHKGKYGVIANVIAPADGGRLSAFNVRFDDGVAPFYSTELALVGLPVGARVRVKPDMASIEPLGGREGVVTSAGGELRVRLDPKADSSPEPAGGLYVTLRESQVERVWGEKVDDGAEPTLYPHVTKEELEDLRQGDPILLAECYSGTDAVTPRRKPVAGSYWTRTKVNLLVPPKVAGAPWSLYYTPRACFPDGCSVFVAPGDSHVRVLKATKRAVAEKLPPLAVGDKATVLTQNRTGETVEVESIVRTSDGQESYCIRFERDGYRSTCARDKLAKLDLPLTLPAEYPVGALVELTSTVCGIPAGSIGRVTGHGAGDRLHIDFPDAPGLLVHKARVRPAATKGELDRHVETLQSTLRSHGEAMGNIEEQIDRRVEELATRLDGLQKLVERATIADHARHEQALAWVRGLMGANFAMRPDSRERPVVPFADLEAHALKAKLEQAKQTIDRTREALRASAAEPLQDVAERTMKLLAETEEEARQERRKLFDCEASLHAERQQREHFEKWAHELDASRLGLVADLASEQVRAKAAEDRDEIAMKHLARLRGAVFEAAHIHILQENKPDPVDVVLPLGRQADEVPGLVRELAQKRDALASAQKLLEELRKPDDARSATEAMLRDASADVVTLARALSATLQRVEEVVHVLPGEAESSACRLMDLAEDPLVRAAKPILERTIVPAAEVKS